MANARRRRFGATKPPEVVFVSTFAIVLLFALYSFGRTYSEGVITTQSSRVLRALEEPDLAVGHRTSTLQLLGIDTNTSP